MDRKFKRKLMRKAKKKRNDSYHRHLKITSNQFDDSDQPKSNRMKTNSKIMKTKFKKHDVGYDYNSDDNNDDDDDYDERKVKNEFNQHQRRLIREEEKEIKRYEKLLKLRSYTKRNKLPKSFYMDGLADLIEFCDKRDNKKNDNELVDDQDDSMQDMDQDEDDFNDEEQNDDMDDEEMDENDDDALDDDTNDANEEFEDNNNDNNEDDDDDSNELHEDIYGFLRDKHGNIVRTDDSTNQRASEKEREEFIRNIVVDENIQRKLRGLLNRLTSTNIKIISNEILQLYRSNGRHIINKGLMNCLDKIIIECKYLLPSKLYTELALLIVILNYEIKDDIIGSYFIHTLICRFDSMISNNDYYETSDKRLNNLIIFILNLYTIGLIDYQLIYDLIDKFLADKFTQSKSIEIIDLILKLVGFQLRKDNPLKLKQLILKIQELCQNIDNNHSSNKRIKFILESLITIKNNNFTKFKTMNDESDTTIVIMNDLIEQIMKSVLKKTKISPISGQYDAILQSSYWNSYQKQIVPLSNATNDEKINIESSSTNHESEIFDKLCRKLRLNTPLRRQLFGAIYAQQDFIQTAAKLISIGKRNSSEIINVIIHVGINEQNYNKYYFYLLKYLVNLNRKYRIALDFAIRDKLIDLKSLSATNRQQLQQLIYDLLIDNCLNITCFKVIEFSDMNEMYVKFIRSIFESIFENQSDETIKVILDKISKKDSRFKSALKLFIACFMDKNAKDRLTSIKQLQVQSNFI